MDDGNINIILAKLILINNLFYRNILLSGINLPIYNDSNITFSTIYPKIPNSVSNEPTSPSSNKKNGGIDSVSSAESSNLFSINENNSNLVKEDTNFLSNKRCKKRRPRRYNQDNIRKKIKRGFFNSALIKKLNDKLKSIGSKKYLEKFPQHFVNDVNQKRNKEILDMTFGEIFEKKELFICQNDKGFSKYFHNLNVLKSEEIKENEEFKKILKKTYRELYEEYINSDEFNVEEINLIKKKSEDDYTKRYIYFARHLIEFFSK